MSPLHDVLVHILRGNKVGLSVCLPIYLIYIMARSR